MHKKSIAIIVLVFLSISFLPAYGKTLRFGMSAAFSGAAKALGTEMQQGIEVYFKQINRSGGINGNALQLITLDDRYEPYLSRRNMQILADNQDILAIIGNVGTPTAMVNVPIANEDKILLFGTLSGAKVLRNTPPSRYVINYRASYAQETDVIIRALLNAGIKPQQIALFTQNDTYGDEGYLGVVQALQYAGYSRKIINQIPHGRYPHNTVNIEAGLNKILQSNKNIKAFVIVGAYKPVAKFIKQAKQYYPNSYYLNVSFVGSMALARELCKDNQTLCKEYSKNIFITQTVPHYKSDIPAAKDFVADLQKFYPQAKPTFVSFEGYLVAKLLVAGLKRAGKHPTREKLIDALERLNKVDIGVGIPLTITKNRHQASDKVWMTTLKYKSNSIDFDQIDNLILESSQ